MVFLGENHSVYAGKIVGWQNVTRLFEFAHFVQILTFSLISAYFFKTLHYFVDFCYSNIFYG